MTLPQGRRAFLIPVAIIATLVGFLGWAAIFRSAGLALSFGLAAAGLAAWTGWLWRRAQSTGEWPTCSAWIRKPHVVQLLVQAGVYVYWGWYWGDVYAQMPLILAQIVFAYGVDLLLSWTRFGNWRAGFGPWPVIGSINLFMWFHDEWFALQFALVLFAYLSRVYITWKSRPGHIFNPSGIALAVFSLVLIVTQTTEISRAADIATHLSDGPFIHLAIFALGLTVQAFVPVVLITMSAAVTALAFSWYTIAQGGVPYFDVIGIPPAVFLGMNLLITDPASSPKNDLAKVLYGASYGLAVVALYPVLKSLGVYYGSADAPVYLAHFDKLLAVPILNLMVPLYDKLGNTLWRRPSARPKLWNLTHQGLWGVAFWLSWPTIVFSAGDHVKTWSLACMHNAGVSCRIFREMLESKCNTGEGEVCLELGIIRTEGAPFPADPEEARRRFDQGCAAGSPTSCSYLGVTLLQDPRTTPAAAAKARQLFQKACDGGSGEGCEKLGLAWLSGVGGPRDIARGQALMAQACEAGIKSACTTP